MIAMVLEFGSWTIGKRDRASHLMVRKPAWRLNAHRSFSMTDGMRWLVLLFSCIVLSQPALADSKTEKAKQAFSGSQAALGQTLPNLSFTNSDGRRIALANFRGKPLLITLVYTGCTDVCPTLIENLYPAIKEAQRTFGSDSFSLLTVGFDVRQDTPELMRSFARAHGADLPNWYFLSTDSQTLDVLAKAVGFAFYSRSGGFDHLAQVSFVDGDGRLYQHVYGAIFEPPLIIEPLKDLIFGRAGTSSTVANLIDRIKFYCTIYDPSSGRYYFNYALFIGMAIGAACFGLVLAFIIREWRRAAAS
ncbi:SCO1 protein [bacterium MnTg02]|nr:SCO1 protein [bacterium MnTg02]